MALKAAEKRQFCRFFVRLRAVSNAFSGGSVCGDWRVRVRFGASMCGMGRLSVIAAFDAGENGKFLAFFP